MCMYFNQNQIPTMDLQSNLHIPTRRKKIKRPSPHQPYASDHRDVSLQSPRPRGDPEGAPTSVGHQKKITKNHPSKMPESKTKRNKPTLPSFLWGCVEVPPPSQKNTVRDPAPSRPFQLAWNLHELCHTNPQHGPLPTPAC